MSARRYCRRNAAEQKSFDAAPVTIRADENRIGVPAFGFFD
jgi:hypothetical protein